MTIKLYHEDSYLKVFSAEVISLDAKSHGVILNQTGFYPGGGGQPADRGTLLVKNNRFVLSKIKTVFNRIIHFLPGDVPLPEVGSELEGEIDWEYRYQLMRTHTAMHVLCGTIFRDYGASVTGGNMTPLQGRMDFEFASLHKDLVQIIENTVNEEIKNARPVSWRSIPRSEAFEIPDLIRTKINLLPAQIEEVRIVEIKGLDLQADGGTHVKNTIEVGQIRIKDYKSKGRENKRIYLEVLD